MAQKKITQLTALSTVATDDVIPIVDTSAGITKKVTVSTLTGNVDLGWAATGETWTYASFDSSNRTGTVTVPTDATTKYSEGMRARFSQSTGGTKYAIITKVETTTLTLFFEDSVTLENEALTTPVYSTTNAFGFPASRENWTITSVVNQFSDATPTASWEDSGDGITLPIGSWRVSFDIVSRIETTSTSLRQLFVALSTGTTSVSNYELQAAIANDNASAGTANAASTISASSYETVTTATEFNILTKINSSGGTGSVTIGYQGGSASWLRIESAYI